MNLNLSLKRGIILCEWNKNSNPEQAIVNNSKLICSNLTKGSDIPKKYSTSKNEVEKKIKQNKPSTRSIVTNEKLIFFGTLCDSEMAKALKMSPPTPLGIKKLKKFPISVCLAAVLNGYAISRFTKSFQRRVKQSVCRVKKTKPAAKIVGFLKLSFNCSTSMSPNFRTSNSNTKAITGRR